MPANTHNGHSRATARHQADVREAARKADLVRCPASDRHAAWLVFRRVSVLVASCRAGRAVICVLVL